MITGKPGSAAVMGAGAVFRGRRASVHSILLNQKIVHGLLKHPQVGRRGFTGEEENPEEIISDLHATLKISKSRAQKGGEVSFTTQGGKKITVKIPAGISSGKKLRLAQQGAECPACHHPGDFILTIKVE